MTYEMYDIHMHLIPYVDDGAANMEMAKSMLKTAREQGVRGIVATPHSSAFFGNEEQVDWNYTLLREHIMRSGEEIALGIGCEVYLDRRNLALALVSLREGLIPTMNGTQYVLSEFSPWESVESAMLSVEALVSAGYLPIIAHAERYYLLQEQDAIGKFREMGCLVQCNVYSVFEEKDSHIRAWANRMLARREVDFLGSDAHRTGHRPPRVETGLRYLYENYDSAYIDGIALENPRKLLRMGE